MCCVSVVEAQCCSSTERFRRQSSRPGPGSGIGGCAHSQARPDEGSADPPQQVDEHELFERYADRLQRATSLAIRTTPEIVDYACAASCAGAGLLRSSRMTPIWYSRHRLDGPSVTATSVGGGSRKPARGPGLLDVTFHALRIRSPAS